MIILTLDVLAHPGEELGARQPTMEGRKLWSMFFSMYQGRICLLAPGVDPKKTKILMEWLKRENYKAGSLDFSYETTADAKLDRVRAIQAGIGRVDWFIDVDPSTITKVIHEGIPSLLVCTPSVPRPEWVKQRDVKAWDQLSQELDAQALVRAERTWED